jgi:hypothetical protein
VSLIKSFDRLKTIGIRVSGVYQVNVRYLSFFHALRV